MYNRVAFQDIFHGLESQLFGYCLSHFPGSNCDLQIPAHHSLPLIPILHSSELLGHRNPSTARKVEGDLARNCPRMWTPSCHGDDSIVEVEGSRLCNIASLPIGGGNSEP